MKKKIVIDTSVLLHDKNSLFQFEDNDIYIPFVVIEELDKKKQAPGLVGEYAREINRYLDDLRLKGRLTEGVCFKDDAKLYVTDKFDDHLLSTLTDGNCNDNKILATCNMLNKLNSDDEVILVTKDINLRIKADVLNIKSSDYYADAKNVDANWKGWSEIEDTNGIISALYKDKKIQHSKDSLSENEYVVVKSGQSSALSVYRKGYLHLVDDKDMIKKNTGCTPKNKEQQFALDAMSNDEIPLVSMSGIPGSGKTYLALMSGMEMMNKGKFERIIYTRPVQSVDKGIGFLPGDMDEKMMPWLGPLSDNFQNAFGDKSYFQMLLDKGKIEIAPISFIRGRSFKNAFIIVDESQNCTVHELKTIITRVAEGSKCVLTGDTKQIDSSYLNTTTNGLTVIADRFRKSSLSAHIHFTKGYRSELATQADELIE
jgi:PhoH-like ATPase